MTETLDEAKLAYLMKDKRYWHPKHRDPAFQAMITEGFQRLYAPKPNSAPDASGPVHVDAYTRGQTPVSEHYRSRPGQGHLHRINDRGGNLPSPGDLDGHSPKDIHDILDFDPEGPRQSQLVKANPIQASVAFSLAKGILYSRKYNTSDAIEPGDPHNNADDAFRHALWSYEMTNAIGAEQAKKFGDAHERVPDNDPSEMAMDLYNNHIGRQLALENKGSDRPGKEIVMEALRQGRLRLRPVRVKQ